MEKIELAPGIAIYSNVIPNSNQLLKDLQEATEEDSIIKWHPPMIIKGGQDVVDYSIRKVEVIGIPFELSKERLLDPKTPEESFKNQIGNLLYVSMQPSIDNYKTTYSVNLEGWQDAYQLLRYGQDNFFNNHIDDSPKYHRRVSLVYYLNDGYEGGEITFSRFGIEYKPKANELLIFPSTYTYNHSVKEVTSGTRYAVVTWLR